jgi:hypothetical protein
VRVFFTCAQDYCPSFLLAFRLAVVRAVASHAIQIKQIRPYLLVWRASCTSKGNQMPVITELLLLGDANYDDFR